MKKIFLTASFIMLTQLCFAQLQKGTWTTSGTVSYSQDTEKKDAVRDFQPNFELSYKSLQIRPNVGYFVADNVELGLLAGYSYWNSTHNSSTRNSSTTNTYEVKSYSAGVYTRLYKFLTDSFAVFGQADANYTKSDVLSEFEGRSGQNYSTILYNTDVNHIAANIRPGVAFFVHDRISLNATYGALSYSRNTNEHNREENIYGQQTSSQFNSDSYDLRLDLSSHSLNLGLSLYFR